jgi:glycosyltransferase involved in cell wall biosynthesis
VKILFVHEVSYRKKVIFEMHEFPELLAERGHDVTFFDFDEGAKFWDGGLTARSEEISGRVHPDAKLRVVRPLQLGVPGLDRLLATITSCFALRSLIKSGRFDAIVLLAVPTYGLQTLRWAKRYRVPVAFRALDVSHKIRNNLLGWAIKQVEKRIYNRADLVLGNNPAMTAYCERLGNRTKPSKTLLAPVDLSHFQSLNPSAKLRDELGFDEGDRVIAYMGSFFYFSGLDEIIGTFTLEQAAGKATGTKLLLIGGGEQDSELRKLVSDLNLEDSVKFTGFIDYAHLPEYLSLATVAINPLKKSLVTDTALPHKVLQYLTLGLPVVSTPLDGLKAVFGDSAGIRWANTPAEILKTAIDFATDKKGSAEASELAKQSVAERLSRDGAVDQLEQILLELKGTK